MKKMTISRKKVTFESDVRDKNGKIIISKGLKVTHKKSKFEYTVDSVLKEPNGDVIVMLASPETPRFGKQKNVLSEPKSNHVLYEFDPQESDSMYYYPDPNEEDSEDDLLAVPAKEFEKEYEVK